MANLLKKVLDWKAVQNWANGRFSLTTHNHDTVYSKLGHTHTDTLTNSFPDFSRVKSLGAQETWKSRTSECYEESGANNTVEGGCPYVLKLMHPCYVMLQYSNTSNFDDDADWGMWWGSDYKHVCALNLNSDSSTAGAIKKMTSENGFTNVGIGTKLFTFQHMADDREDSHCIWLVMSVVGWYYRPFIGSGGSSNENWEYWDFKLIPMIGTPSGTLLVERYMFTADNSKSSLLNTNVQLGTMSGNNNVMTYYNKDSNPTASKTITRPGKFYA